MDKHASIKRSLGSRAGFDPAFVAEVLDAAMRDAPRSGRCRVYAIAGLQGSGKSTLAAQVAALGRTRKLKVAVLSIDDVYFGKRERQRLGREIHPLLATRGPPGTHDIALACETLDALRAGLGVRLPRFDKADDRRDPPSRWPQARDIDLALFEGWCLKVPAQTDAELLAPINRLEREEDPQCFWRRYCNTALANDYPALWRRLPRLLWLQPPNFEVVPGWRWQQELALRRSRRASARGDLTKRPGMRRAEVERFVQLFERVSRQAMRHLPTIAERTVPLAPDRRVIA